MPYKSRKPSLHDIRHGSPGPQSNVLGDDLLQVQNDSFPVLCNDMLDKQGMHQEGIRDDPMPLTNVCKSLLNAVAKTLVEKIGRQQQDNIA